MGKKRALRVGSSLSNETSKEQSGAEQKSGGCETESVMNEKPKTKKEKPQHDDEGRSCEDSINKKKKPGHEIEEIFSTLKKRKKPDQGQTGEVAEAASTKQKLKKKKNKAKQVSSKESGFVDPPKPRGRTEDGLAIYSAEELGFGKSDAGGTPLCPFDCDCCF
ncbi:hypothetical protein H6P81_007572 [Aristolochia fimbriata]|uniref:DUF1764 domain-containing protein n=1 Tax=Aristolochia fimbriata TaxID=158543 RepID=A0AAV7F551_ARIFI|nr:hypothetical protein H6P81_007572 [Aristolochia fimbriata]